MSNEFLHVAADSEAISRIDRRTKQLMALLAPPQGENLGEQIMNRVELQTQAILALAERQNEVEARLIDVLKIVQRLVACQLDRN